MQLAQPGLRPHLSPRSQTMAAITAFSTCEDKRSAAEMAPPLDTPAKMPAGHAGTRVSVHRKHRHAHRPSPGTGGRDTHGEVKTGAMSHAGSSTFDFGQGAHGFLRFPLADVHCQVDTRCIKDLRKILLWPSSDACVSQKTRWLSC